MARYVYNNEGEPDAPVMLIDGELWSETVLDDMENANWHSARAAFEDLIRLLPVVYRELPKPLKARLQQAVDKWDREF